MEPVFELSLQRLARDKGVLRTALPILREVHRRLHHPFYTYKPDDHADAPQLQFHQSDAWCRLMFGGNQSGKSRSGAQEAAWWLNHSHPYLKTPKAPRIYVISANYRTVQEGIYKHLRSVLPRWRIANEGPQVPGWQVPSYILMQDGAQVDFITAQGVEEARKKIQAAEIDLGIIDEEVDGVVYGELMPRLLARDGKLIVTATLYNSEPWCLDLEDRADTGEPGIEVFRLSSYRAAERGHISRTALRRMEAGLSKEDIEVRLLGRSRRYEGLIYKEFGRKHVIEPFPIPKEWTRYCSLDAGFRTLAGLWAAVGPDGKYVLYREIYYHGAKAMEVAEAILATEGYQKVGRYWIWQRGEVEDIRIRWMDPSGFGHHETGELKYGTLFALYSQELGVGSRLACVPAQNAVNYGIEMCRRSLGEDMDGIPKMRVFNTLTNFIKECRRYRMTRDRRDVSKPEPRDMPVKRDDHLLDDWRYLEAGGLTYVKPGSERRETDYDFPHEYSLTADDRMREHWAKLMRRQRAGDANPPHPAGLGSEY
jgi:hypothetical protein